MPQKPDLSKWQDRVRQVAKYHQACIEENSKWRLSDTARELQRSQGRISEDLMLAEAILNDEVVSLFLTAQEAIDYCRKKKAEARLARFVR
jgi:two-component sensor histidine kinase